MNNINYKDLHFIWFVGHALTAVNTTLFLLSFALFHPVGFFYRAAYFFIVGSYSLVLFNTHKANRETLVNSILTDENVSFLVISIYFLMTRRIAITLIPFYIYSIFHVLQYSESEFIPKVAPDQTALQAKIKDIVTKYHLAALELASKVEVLGVMARLVFGLFILRSTLFSIALYGYFLRQRFIHSTISREVIVDQFKKLDRFLSPPTAHPKVPAAVIDTYAKVKQSMLNQQESHIKQ